LSSILTRYLVEFLTHYVHHHFLQKTSNLLNPQMNTLGKKGKLSSLPKTLSFEFDISVYDLVFVHLPPIKKHNNFQFFHSSWQSGNLGNVNSTRIQDFQRFSYYHAFNHLEVGLHKHQSFHLQKTPYVAKIYKKIEDKNWKS
jgi:hypothetical protein